MKKITILLALSIATTSLYAQPKVKLGTDFIYNEFSKGYRFETIREYWHKDDVAFKEWSTKYYLYR